MDLGDGRVWVDDRGGPGVPVILLHPGWGDASIWDGVLARLPSRLRAVRYDNRGYGRSPAPATPFSWHDDLVAVMDRLDVPRALIVGHSGGGASALGVALSHPDRVASLVLLAPGIPDFPWPERDGYFTRFDALFAAGDRAGLVDLGLRTWASADTGSAARTQISGAVSAMFACGDRQLPDPPALDRLHLVSARTHVLIGELDHHSVLDCARTIAARVPTCALTVVPGADHLLPLRHPDLVVRAVDRAGRLTPGEDPPGTP